MTYRITRVEKDGTRSIVGFTDDQCEIGVMIDEDRDKYDWEPQCYDVGREKEGENDETGAN